MRNQVYNVVFTIFICHGTHIALLPRIIPIKEASFTCNRIDAMVIYFMMLFAAQVTIKLPLTVEIEEKWHIKSGPL